MSEKNVGVQGRLGAIKYFPANDDKQAIAYLRVAEEVYAPPTKVDGKNVWADPETVWHDVTVKRALAERVEATLQDGDPVVVIGDRVTSQREHEGRTFTDVTIFASSVSPDLSRDVVVVDREAREQRRAARQSVAGDVAQEADQAAQAAPLVDPDWPTVAAPGSGATQRVSAAYAQ